ncbi:A/G-specific adenine glycosylase [Lactococcus nasutitermitis]|uniref:Adenine DNA glycosylase n=1 Tax=Lactococcus nasutitermitis TaxID=1652957 RepID=A0ABV9JE89_9LACT|nr:A/G-specific adenine glycosylase [Lactococcus nasutitermitis]
MELTENKISSFQKDILNWYDKNKKALPWRETKNPYMIWISEIMSQQTQVETVMPYYSRFIAKYPNLKALAEANDEELLKLWEGLGYYSRARNLKIAAGQIVSTFDSIFPNQLSDILSLKGIGPYTAAAISSISFNLAEPAIDGNLLRVTSRLFELDDDISKASSRKIFDEKLRLLISQHRPGDFNQALMDLGSMICSPKAPLCEECPIQKYCDAYQHQTQENFPVKTKKLKQKPVYYQAFALELNGKYLMIQRPETGLLANMWTFPMIEVEDKENKVQIPAELRQQVVKTEVVGEITHVFSHLKWYVTVIKCQLATDIVQEVAPLSKQEWISKEDFKTTVFPKPQLKMFDLIKKA